MTRTTTWRRTGLAAVAAGALLALSACGGGSIADETKKNEEAAGSGSCGDLNLAVNPWVGFEADAYVVGTLAEKKLGCNVSYKDLKEDVSWQGFSTGDIDVVLEDWGHPDLEAKYFKAKGDGSAVNMGPTGNEGVIGWYVPPWLAKAHPDILSYKNLNKYASKFKTSESGSQGQFLGADPSYVQFDQAIAKNLKLDFKVVFSGSEAATITAFQQAEKNKQWLIGYFYAPQWLFADVDLKKVALPPYKPGCEDDKNAVACDYPVTKLQKVVSTKWAAKKSPAVSLVKKFHWTNDDQNVVAKYIAEDKMKPEDAAQKWIDDNPDKVKAWMS